MYKRSNEGWMKHFDFLILDVLAFQLAFIASYLLRFGIKSPFSSAYYLKISVLLLFTDCCAALFNSSYRGIMQRGIMREAGETLRHVAVTLAMLLLYLFMTKQNSELARGFFVYLVATSVIFIWSLRCAHKSFIIRRSLKRPDNRYHMIVLAAQSNVETVLANLKTSGCLITGICLADCDRTGDEINGIPVVASQETLLDYIKSNVVDGVFTDLPDEIPLPSKILNTCALMGVSTHIGVMKSHEQGSERIVEKIGGYTALTSCVKLVSPVQIIFKRFVDILAGLVGVLVTAICFIFVAPAIYIASPGPIFFSQTRVGKNGRKFKIYKFRSMYMDAEERKKELMAQNKIADGLMFKMDDDPRIIKGIGHFIRDYSIDELPQLLNVLKGDMSLIGTRPPTVEEYEKYDYHHNIRLAVKPGITGMWQVSGRSNITDFEQVVALDASYITNWSIGLDIKILLKTVKVVLKRDGAS